MAIPLKQFQINQLPEPTVPGNPVEGNVPEPSVADNPPPISVKLKKPLENPHYGDIPEPDPPPSIKPRKVPTGKLQEDRIEWSLNQVKFFETLKKWALEEEPLKQYLNYPELRQFGASGNSPQEIVSNDVITAARVLFSGYQGFLRLKSFLSYNIRYTRGKQLSRAAEPLSGENAWESLGFDLQKTLLALEEKKLKTKHPQERPTFPERKEAVTKLHTNLTTISGKAFNIQAIKDQVNPRLYLEILAFYPSTLTGPTFTIPFFVSDIQYTPESKFSAINVLGRNLKRYHYSGAEDSLEFKIILKEGTLATPAIDVAKGLASLTKANSDGETPLITLGFRGTIEVADFFPFGDHKYYVLTKAPFKPTRFRPKDLRNLASNDGLGNFLVDFSDNTIAGRAEDIPLNPQPMYIEQVLYLKRISDTPHEIY